LRSESRSEKVLLMAASTAASLSAVKAEYLRRVEARLRMATARDTASCRVHTLFFSSRSLEYATSESRSFFTSLLVESHSLEASAMERLRASTSFM
jgi:hypothetical protein